MSKAATCFENIVVITRLVQKQNDVKYKNVIVGVVRGSAKSHTSTTPIAVTRDAAQYWVPIYTVILFRDS
jgi:hypothetical protein